MQSNDTLAIGLWRAAMDAGSFGASINVGNGEPPTEGYMVSMRGAELRTDYVPSHALLVQWARHATAGIVNGYLYYVGYWRSGKHHVFDLSACVSDRQWALRLAEEHGQEAIYDVANGTPIILRMLGICIPSAPASEHKGKPE